MSEDSFYNIYRYAFEIEGQANGEEKGNFGGRPAKEYGNTIVAGLFNQNNQQIETEAVLTLNVWMAVAHELHETWRAYHFDYNMNASMTALDRAATLWIGKNQTFGSNEERYFLYRLAEIAGERFG